jgi:hypothetical protein
MNCEEYVILIVSNIYVVEERIEALETVLHEEQTSRVQCCMRNRLLRNGATREADG